MSVFFPVYVDSLSLSLSLYLRVELSKTETSSSFPTLSLSGLHPLDNHLARPHTCFNCWNVIIIRQKSEKHPKQYLFWSFFCLLICRSD